MKTILSVEDNEKNMKLALEKIPALVLMDIQLPGISGIEAFKRLRADARTAAIPIIAFTASVTPTDRSQVTDAGFNAFLSKPINLKEFVATIQRLLEKQTA
jgi:two-component system, cell cycle response regulator DivK